MVNVFIRLRNNLNDDIDPVYHGIMTHCLGLAGSLLAKTKMAKTRSP